MGGGSVSSTVYAMGEAKVGMTWWWVGWKSGEVWHLLQKLRFRVLKLDVLKGVQSWPGGWSTGECTGLVGRIVAWMVSCGGVQPLEIRTSPAESSPLPRMQIPQKVASGSVWWFVLMDFKW
jgi:hypothetical protein